MLLDERRFSRPGGAGSPEQGGHEERDCQIRLCYAAAMPQALVAFMILFLSAALLRAFNVLNRIEYSAPWADQRKRTPAC